MGSPTYIPLATVTLGGSDADITFASIPATYRDLVLIIDTIPTAATQDILARFNSDTGSNYSYVEAGGNGSATYSGSATRTGNLIGYLTTAARTQMRVMVMDYSAVDKHKTTLVRQDAPSEATAMRANRWANTAAVTSITVLTTNSTFAANTTMSLFGIAG